MKIMMHLKRHPNIVRLLGVITKNCPIGKTLEK